MGLIISPEVTAIGSTSSNTTGGAIIIQGDSTGTSASKSGNTITLGHADTSSQGNVAAATNSFISGMSFDTYGHVTGITTGSPAGFVKNLGVVQISPAGYNTTCTTAQFIADISAKGAFTATATVMKCTWDYAGNNDITDTGFGQLELAGCIVESFTDGAQYIVRVTSPSTGTGAGGIHEYINHGSSYAPGWRRVYTSQLNGNITGNVSGSSGSCTGNAATATTAGSITSQANSATITATSSNTANQIVLRDGSGNFSAGTITATFSGSLTGNVTGNVSGSSGSCTGNAATATTAAKFDSSVRNYNREWIEMPNYTGLYSPNNSAHFYPNNNSYGSWKITGERNGWRGIHFGEGSGMTLMMNEGEFGFHRESVGWAARFTAGTFHGNAATATSAGSITSQANSATINATSSNTANQIVLRDGSGNFSAGLITATATTARYSDLAENYVADADYEPGTVLMIGGDKEVTLAQNETIKVAGVVSTAPAHLMNNDCVGEFVVAIALTGRVPCKVVGTVRKGDLMISAGNGMAKSTGVYSPKIGQVIGKSLENFDGLEGVIEVMVGRF